MKKVLVGLMVVAVVACLAAPVSAEAKDPAAAGLLSAIVPGAGEWYNSDWKNGGFPWGECVVGHICPCFSLASVFDAVNGDATTGMRFDFWTAPGSK